MSITGSYGQSIGNITNTDQNQADINSLTVQVSTNTTDIAALETVVADINADQAVQDSRITNVENTNTSQDASLASILTRITDIQYGSAGDSTIIYNRLSIRQDISSTSSTPQLTIMNTSSEAPNRVSMALLAGCEQGFWSSLVQESDHLFLSRYYESATPNSYVGGVCFVRHGSGTYSGGCRWSMEPSIASQLQSPLNMYSFGLTCGDVVSNGTNLGTAITDLDTRVDALEAAAPDARLDTLEQITTGLTRTGTTSNISGNLTVSGIVTGGGINLNQSIININTLNTEQNSRLSAVESIAYSYPQTQYGILRTIDNQLMGSGSGEFAIFGPDIFPSTNTVGPQLVNFVNSGTDTFRSTATYVYHFSINATGLYEFEFSWSHISNYPGTSPPNFSSSDTEVSFVLAGERILGSTIPDPLIWMDNNIHSLVCSGGTNNTNSFGPMISVPGIEFDGNSPARWRVFYTGVYFYGTDDLNPRSNRYSCTVRAYCLENMEIVPNIRLYSPSTTPTNKYWSVNGHWRITRLL